jgi:hypothetical protein
MNTLADMTVDDLRQLILDLLEEQRLTGLFGKADMDESAFVIEDEFDPRSLAEVFDSVERNRWTPPPGSPTPSEMIRQDRDER